ncbi:MAG: glycosyltransferase [Bacteroidales bacterium]|jgi:sugar transferase (PEP-CTERM/EpsH1 system associated)|nr:glycosyltransferase [Bacteroidales bacterium]
MKILAVLSRLPYPLEKGDKLRAYYQLRELAKNNEVYLFCLNNSEPHPKAKDILLSFLKDVHISEFSTIDALEGLLVSFFDGTPFQTGYYSHRKNIKDFKSYCKKIHPDVIFYQFVRMAKYTDVSYPKVLDFQDALSVNMEGRAKKSRGIVKFIFKNETKRLKKYEAKMFDIFDKLTIIVDADKKAISSPRQNEIIVLPNGVDEAYFNYNTPQKKEFDIIFSGGMNYSPNVIAANYLVKEIMPKVWEKYPKTNLVLAGANPTASVKSLASDKVIVTGWVDDMKDYYAKARIFIAPMQIGTGLQNKLLEAMAMNLPCITSSLANDALKATNNKNIIIADTPQENADAIILLLTNPELADAIAKRGNEFVKENYRWETFNKVLEQTFCSIIQK